MFKKNDKSLLRVRGLFRLIYVITLTCSIVAGVFFLLASIGLGSKGSTTTGLFAGTSIGLALIFGVAVPIALWIGWQFINLLFTYMIDVKLIRNKIYKVYDMELLELACDSSADIQKLIDVNIGSTNNKNDNSQIDSANNSSDLANILAEVKSILSNQLKTKQYTDDDFYKNGYVDGTNKVLQLFDSSTLTSQNIANLLLEALKYKDFDSSYAENYIRGMRDGTKNAVKLTLYYLESSNYTFGDLDSIKEIKELL
ncbi:MAG: hypothetical protein IKD20_06040 [Clostridia bacterium]|nr:hypothetical protein [Clostridia bacterium]